MIEIEVPVLNKKFATACAIGEWLDKHMPNPPLPDEQKWTVIDRKDGFVGIRFSSNEDAMWFQLRWGNQ